jgi:hypothetical protein
LFWGPDPPKPPTVRLVAEPAWGRFFLFLFVSFPFLFFLLFFMAGL